MIDELNTELIIDTPLQVIEQIEKPFLLNGMQFIPRWHENGFISYHGKLENLRISLLGDKLQIKNSWHKYHKGNNYSDYSHTDLINTFYKLQTELGESLEGAKVKRIAYGCVINENPYLNFPNWLFYKTKSPLAMYHNGQQYGSFFDFTDYKIKGYDKTFEVWKHEKIRIPENYFRIENEVKYMKHLHNRKEPINIYTPKDLFNFEIMQQLGEDLLNKYNTIEKRPFMSFNGLSTGELNIIASMQNELIREQLKKEHPKTYKRYKTQYKELTSGINSEYYQQVETKIQNKITNLINT